MADTLTVTAGVVATDDRGALGHVQRVMETGGTAFANGPVSIPNSNTAVVAARATRKSVLVRSIPTNTQIVYVGTGTVSAANGFGLWPGESVTIETTDAVNAISASGTMTVHYIEVYDS